MKVAEHRISNPLLGSFDRLSAGMWAINNKPKFEMVKIAGEIVTLAHIDVPVDNDNLTKCLEGKEFDSVKLVAGALFNPEDGQINRKVGRTVAVTRLVDYLKFGTVKRHKDGRSADHFLIEVSKEDLKQGGWHKAAARLMLLGTHMGPFIVENNCCGTGPCCPSESSLVDGEGVV